MSSFTSVVKQADWKSEKHAPVIECASTVKAGETLNVTVSIGKEIAHPNTTEHHIRWIAVYFQPEGESKSYQIGHFEFCAHGESTEGANQGPVFTHHAASFGVQLKKSGTIQAVSFCNIHGVWESSASVTVQ